MKLRAAITSLALSTAFIGATGCDYAVELAEETTTQSVEREQSGEVTIEVGDIPEDCSGTSGSVTYIHRSVGDVNYCLIVMTWDELLVDMVEVRDQVEAAAEEAVPGGGDNAEVEFTEFSVEDFSVELVKGDGDEEDVTLGFDQVEYYLASLTVAELQDVVSVDWPVPGEDTPSSEPRLTFSADGDDTARQALLDYLNEAYTAGGAIRTQGHAELEFEYETAADLDNMSGSRLKIDYTVNVVGEGRYDLNNSFDNPDDDA
jgi:hypothetical protein